MKIDSFDKQNFKGWLSSECPAWLHEMAAYQGSIDPDEDRHYRGQGYIPLDAAKYGTYKGRPVWWKKGDTGSETLPIGQFRKPSAQSISQQPQSLSWVYAKVVNDNQKGLPIGKEIAVSIRHRRGTAVRLPAT